MKNTKNTKKNLTKVLIIGASGGPRCGIVNCCPEMNFKTIRLGSLINEKIIVDLYLNFKNLCKLIPLRGEQGARRYKFHPIRTFPPICKKKNSLMDGGQTLLKLQKLLGVHSKKSMITLRISKIRT
jgi:hypothetical protein